MTMEIRVAEAFELIKEISKQPGGFFEMIHTDVKAQVEEYLFESMEV